MFELVNMRRLKIFVGGVLASAVIVGVFFLFAWLLNDAAEYAWIARVLGVVFAVLNPLIVVIDRLILRRFPAPPAAGRLALKVGFVAVFFGWWWLVAVVGDRVLKQRHHDQRAA
jgi:hypothetical protein